MCAYAHYHVEPASNFRERPDLWYLYQFRMNWLFQLGIAVDADGSLDIYTEHIFINDNREFFH